MSLAWDDPLLWGGAYVAAGVGLVASDLAALGADEATRRGLAAQPRWLVYPLGVVVLAAFLLAWPLPAAARLAVWVGRRLGKLPPADAGEGDE